MTRAETEQLSRLTVIVERMDKRAEEDRRDRKAAEEMAVKSREAVRTELHDLKNSQDGLTQRLSRVEKTTREFESLRGNIRGAMVLLGVVGSIIAVPLAIAWKWVWAKLTGEA